jgi:hypothetical protein
MNALWYGKLGLYKLYGLLGCSSDFTKKKGFGSTESDNQPTGNPQVVLLTAPGLLFWLLPNKEWSTILALISLGRGACRILARH